MSYEPFLYSYCTTVARDEPRREARDEPRREARDEPRREARDELW